MGSGGFVRADHRFELMHMHSGGGSVRGARVHAVAPFRRKLGVFSPLVLLDAVLPVIHPAGTTRTLWNILMLCCALYIATLVPLRIAFHEIAAAEGLGLWEWTVTAVLAVDVVVNARTAYITKQGELVRDSKLIAARYLRGMFVLDVVSAIPFAVLLAGSARRYAMWAELVKLTRLRQLVWMLRSSGKYSNFVSMLRLIIYLSLSAHWACCFWHYLSESVPSWPWMFSQVCPTCSQAEHYLLGLYSAFLLLLGDRQDTHNNLERIIVTCLLFVGTLLYAVVVGSMAVLVSSAWATASRHKQRAMMVTDALRYRGVHTDVQDKVCEYFDFLARFDHPGADGVAFLQELPVGLYASVMASMFAPVLAKVQLFAHCERPFLWRLAQRLRLSLYMAGDVIYELGSVGHDMYIIWKGAVGLVARDGCVAALLADGEHFGELGLMTASSPRPHRAVALRPCDVVLLGRWDLQDAMKDFPESAALVKERARSRVEDHEAASSNLWAFAMASLDSPFDDDEAPQPSRLEPDEDMSRSSSLAASVGTDGGQKELLTPDTHGADGSSAGDGGVSTASCRKRSGGPLAEATEAAASGGTDTPGVGTEASISPCSSLHVVGRGALPAAAIGAQIPAEAGLVAELPTMRGTAATGRVASARRGLVNIGSRLLTSLRRRQPEEATAVAVIADLAAAEKGGAARSAEGSACPEGTAVLRADISSLSRRMSTLAVVPAAPHAPESAPTSAPAKAAAIHTAAERRGSLTRLVSQPECPPDVLLCSHNTGLSSAASRTEAAGQADLTASPFALAGKEQRSSTAGTHRQRSRSRTLWFDSLQSDEMYDATAPYAEHHTGGADAVSPFASVQLTATVQHSPRIGSPGTGSRRNSQRLQSSNDLVPYMAQRSRKASVEMRLRRRSAVLPNQAPSPSPAPLPYAPDAPTLDDVWRQIQQAAAGGGLHKPDGGHSNNQSPHQRRRRGSVLILETPRSTGNGTLHRSPAGSGNHAAATGQSQPLASSALVVPLSASALAAASMGAALPAVLLTRKSSLPTRLSRAGGSGEQPAEPAVLAHVGAPNAALQAAGRRSLSSSASGLLPNGRGPHSRTAGRAAAADSSAPGPAPSGPLFLRRASSTQVLSFQRGGAHRSFRGYSRSRAMRSSVELGRVSQDEDGWSSDDSTSRLVDSLRQQLGKSNARVLHLESRLGALLKDPMQVPAVRAVVQREVEAALARSAIQVDTKLSDVRGLLEDVAVRAEELSQQVAAADDRLQRLEEEQGGRLQLTVVPTAALHGISSGATRPSGSGGGGGGGGGSLRAMQARVSGTGSGAFGSTRRLAPLSHAGMLHSPSMSRGGVGLQRNAAVRSRSGSGSVSGSGMIITSAVGGKRVAGGRFAQAPLQGILKAAGSPEPAAASLGLDQDWSAMSGALSPGHHRPGSVHLPRRHSRAGLAKREDESTRGSRYARSVSVNASGLVAQTTEIEECEDEGQARDAGSVHEKQRYRRAATASVLVL